MRLRHIVLISTLLLAVAGSGCIPTKQARIAAVGLTLQDVARAAARNNDPDLVAAAMPAYLLLIEGLLASEPDDEQLLVAACRAYTTYAASFVEEVDPEHARTLYARARRYGHQALGRHGDLAAAINGGLESYRSFLATFRTRDVPTLFWTASAWAAWIKSSTDDLEALADIPYLEATVERALELDDTYEHGAPHLLMAVYLAAKPGLLGGDLKRAREHFRQAFEIGGKMALTAKVLFARYYAVGMRDRQLFEQTLRQVLAAPADVVPELTLANVLAQKRAQTLLEKADALFAAPLQ